MSARSLVAARPVEVAELQRDVFRGWIATWDACSRGWSPRSAVRGIICDAGYGPAVLELVEPTQRPFVAWSDAHNDWGPGAHEDGFRAAARRRRRYLCWVRALACSAGRRGGSGLVATWARDLRLPVDRRAGPGPGRHRLASRTHRVPAPSRACIGYGVRPSARRQGCRELGAEPDLEHARQLGLHRVLLVCAADNIASARTIERQGGALGDIRTTDLGPARRYWITFDNLDGVR